MHELHHPHRQRSDHFFGRPLKTARISATATRTPYKPEICSDQSRELLLQQLVNLSIPTTERNLDQVSTSVGSGVYEEIVSQSEHLVTTGRRLRSRQCEGPLSERPSVMDHASPKQEFGLNQEEEQTYCYILQVKT